jgi:hypothetical protein
MSKVFHGMAASVALSLVALAASPALAGGPPGEGGEHHNHFFAGVNAVALGVIKPEAAKFAVGAGGFFEFTVVPNWLEIEVAFHYVNAGGLHELPFDVLLKKPFHVNKWFHPYVGLGGLVVPVFASEAGTTAVKVEGGLASVVGSYFWFSKHVGWSVDINYNLLFGDGGVTHEMGATSGVVFGW